MVQCFKDLKCVKGCREKKLHKGLQKVSFPPLETRLTLPLWVYLSLVSLHLSSRAAGEPLAHSWTGSLGIWPALVMVVLTNTQN